MYVLDYRLNIIYMFELGFVLWLICLMILVIIEDVGVIITCYVTKSVF